MEAEYVRELVRMERKAHKLIEAWIAANSKEALTQDAGEADLLRRLEGLFSDPKNMRAFFGRVSSLVDADVVSSFASIVPTVPRSALVAPVSLGKFATTNARLIKSVPNLAVKDLAKVIRTGAGSTDRALQTAIQNAFGVGKSRAEFWARDQTLKLHGQITKARHQKAGIDTYYWTASGDEKVRDIHAELGARSNAGEVFKYKDPPIISEDGRRGNPGDDFNCRCTAYPNLNTALEIQERPGKRPAEVAGAAVTAEVRRRAEGAAERAARQRVEEARALRLKEAEAASKKRAEELAKAAALTAAEQLLRQAAARRQAARLAEAAKATAKAEASLIPTESTPSGIYAGTLARKDRTWDTSFDGALAVGRGTKARAIGELAEVQFESIADMADTHLDGMLKHQRGYIDGAWKALPPGNKAHISSIQDFSGNAYTQIRQFERTGEEILQGSATMSKNITEAIADAKKRGHSYQGTVYRGIQDLSEADATKILGQKSGVDFGGTASSSWDPSVAASFSRLKRGNQGPRHSWSVVYRIQQKSGLPIQHVSLQAHEREVLLGKNARFRQVGATKMKGQNVLVIDLEEE